MNRYLRYLPDGFGRHPLDGLIARFVLVLCAAVAISGCAGFGTGQTQVPEQDGRPILSTADRQLSDAYNRLHSARKSVALMAARKSISEADRRAFEAEANKIRRNLDLAVAASGAGRDSQASLALNALLLLEASLKAKEGK